MTTGLVSCQPHTPLVEVAKLMSRHRIHAVYVFDYGDEGDVSPELWGLVSDLDLVGIARAGLAGRTAAQSAVEPIVTVTSDAPLEHAAQLMAEHGTSHLAVLDAKSHRPAGVISTLDIARLLSGDNAQPAGMLGPRRATRSMSARTGIGLGF